MGDGVRGGLRERWHEHMGRWVLARIEIALTGDVQRWHQKDIPAAAGAAPSRPESDNPDGSRPESDNPDGGSHGPFPSAVTQLAEPTNTTTASAATRSTIGLDGRA